MAKARYCPNCHRPLIGKKVCQVHGVQYYGAKELPPAAMKAMKKIAPPQPSESVFIR